MDDKNTYVRFIDPRDVDFNYHSTVKSLQLYLPIGGTHILKGSNISVRREPYHKNGKMFSRKVWYHHTLKISKLSATQKIKQFLTNRPHYKKSI